MTLLQDYVRHQAESRPEVTAVVCGDQRLTYGELEASSNRLARLLQASGCERGDRVCFAIPKSSTALIALLGIMKADCWHVPLDSSSPPVRGMKIIQSSQPRLVLGTGATAVLLEEMIGSGVQSGRVQVGWLDNSRKTDEHLNSAFSWNDLQHCSPETLNHRNSDGDPAHILFTSGSTGEPKGVVITHANVIHFIEWSVKYFGIQSSDRISCHSPLHFDLSYFDIFGAFAAGAQLHLVPPEVTLLPNQIANFIRSSELTQWFSVPSVLSYMAKFEAVKFGDFPTLKRLLWCGDVLSTPTLIYLMKRLPQAKFTNLYGPTETTIASSFYTLAACPTDDKEAVPIGKGCEGEELLVLDEALQPVPRGETGDLYIQGVGLSPGYWRDTQKTSAAFLRYGPKDSRIYRTGDLARFGEDGLVYFVGRTDSQIKCRGYRIELGEIEAALHSLGGVCESAVVAIENADFEGKLICCAYATPDGNKNLSIELRRRLSNLLPTHMLPSRWKGFDKLPTNPNGKIDRAKLKELFLAEERKIVPSPLISPDVDECGSSPVPPTDKSKPDCVKVNAELDSGIVSARNMFKRRTGAVGGRASGR